MPKDSAGRVSVADKSLPPRAWGLTDAEFSAAGMRLSDLQTPILTLDESALTHNEDTMFTWINERGLALAPHGKTTMAPTLWSRLVRAGAWGLTVATAWQAQVARAFGIQRIMIAGEVLDPVGLRWAAGELGDPEVDIFCWVDSVQAVEAMEAILGQISTARPFPVLVELGGEGGRAGARGVTRASRVIDAVSRSAELRLAGVAGWEGSLAHDRSAPSLARVQALLDSMLSVTRSTDWPARPIVSAGGSAFFDVVADALASVSQSATPLLRSGAFQVHDAGHYSHVSPLRNTFRSAMHGWSRVLSTPEPGIAILDGGKRDFPYDEGLPWTDHGAVVRTNDQHAYLAADDVAVGSVLRLELSHPCTAFDKWRCIPLVRSLEDEPEVIGLVRTYF